MKIIVKKIILIFMLVVMALPISVFADTANEEEVPENPDINILFSHDMHSHLEKFGKIKTLVETSTKANPSTFLFDAGDFSMGTPFQSIYKSEASELRSMGEVGYDVATLGNHEFDYHSLGLSQMLTKALESKEKLPQIVISNIDWGKTLGDKDKKTDGQMLRDTLTKYGVKDYTVVEKEGAKIAVFGIFGKESASYAPESGTYFKDPVETAKKVVKKIKENEDVDLIVCLSHSGTNAEEPENSEDEILAKNVDGIDLIVSGHSHTELPEPITANGTIIVSAGQYNTNLGNIVFTYEEGKYVLKQYNLTPLDAGVADDKKTDEKIEEFKKLVDEEYFSEFGFKWDQVIAKSPYNFTPIEGFGLEQGEDTLGNIVADSYIYGVQQAEGDSYETAAVAVVPAGVIRGSFSEGDITVADAFNALSLGTGPDGKSGYPLVSIYLTGAELRTMAEVDISVSEMMQPARLYMSGIKYSYNPHRLILNRAYNVSLVSPTGQEEELDSKKLYRVIGDLYSCQMLGTVNSQSYGLLSITPKDKDGREIKDFENQIIYNENGTELKEWYGLASYIDSFSGDVVPEKYGKLDGRKELIDSKNIIERLKDPNRLFIMFVCLVILAIALLLLIIVLIVKLIKRIKYGKNYAKRKKYPKMPKEKSIFSNRTNKYK